MIKSQAGRLYSPTGFSLLEVLIVMVIIGIVAAFAYPSYQKYIQRSNRTDAITGLMALSVSQERYLALNREYSNSSSVLGMTLSPNGLYELRIVYGRWSGSDCSAATDDSSSTRRYTLLAIPVADKSQAADTDCGCLYVNDIGDKQATGSNNARCWN